jgi:hypothetical protein
MIDKTQTTTKPQPTPAPAPARAPEPAPKPAEKPVMARDSIQTSKPAESKDKDKNPLADSAGRTGADVVSGTSSAAETAKDARTISTIARTAGTRVSWLSRLGSGVANVVTKVADWGDRVALQAPKLAKGFLGLAKAAPFIGVGVAALDIGKAVLEKDPEKKKVAEGQAALSVLGGAAGVVGLVALATPLAPIALGIGIGTAVLSIADTALFGGKVSKAISGGMHAVADGAKKAWNALTSL